MSVANVARSNSMFTSLYKSSVDDDNDNYDYDDDNDDNDVDDDNDIYYYDGL